MTVNTVLTVVSAADAIANVLDCRKVVVSSHAGDFCGLLVGSAVCVIHEKS